MQLKYLYILPLITMSVLFGQDSVLTYQKLESLVIQNNLDLKVLSGEIEARKGKVLQSSLRYNPEFEFESGAGGDPETIIQLNQTIRLGGKRQKLVKVSELELEKVKMNYEIHKLNILRDAKTAFIDVLLYQKILELYAEKVTITEEFITNIKNKVAAGQLSQAEISRAQVALSSSQVNLINGRRMLRNYWKQLESMWGGTILDYKKASGNLESISIPPPKKSIFQKINSSPRLTIKDLDIKIQEAALKLEKASRIPDLTIGAGYRQTDAPNPTLQANLSLPLQFFDRNQGSIMAAQRTLEQIQYEKKAVGIQLKKELNAAFTELEMAYEEISTLESIILLEAENAYQIIHDGYQQGKYVYLDVVDVRNTLFEAKENYYFALSDYQKAKAELERLVGKALISNENE